MLNKQSKILTKDQIEACKEYINNTSKFKARDTLIFLLSTLAGLRMHEIANLDWYMVLDSNNTLSKALLIPNKASKGRTGGRAIPLHNDLYNAFKTYLNSLTHTPTPDTPLIPSQKSDRIKSHTLVKLLKHWYTELEFIGCTSHSGRRTFVTSLARNLKTTKGSLRDIQSLTGHSSINTLQIYIDSDPELKLELINTL